MPLVASLPVVQRFHKLVGATNITRDIVNCVTPISRCGAMLGLEKTACPAVCWWGVPTEAPYLCKDLETEDWEI